MRSRFFKTPIFCGDVIREVIGGWVDWSSNSIKHTLQSSGLDAVNVVIVCVWQHTFLDGEAHEHVCEIVVHGLGENNDDVICGSMFQKASKSDEVLTSSTSSKAATTVHENVDLAFLGAISAGGRIVNVSILIESVITEAVLEDAVLAQEFCLSVLSQNTFGLPIHFSWLPFGVSVEHPIKMLQNLARHVISTVSSPPC